jgi:hypothetical protein
MVTHVVRNSVLVAVLLVACIGIVACGGSDEPDLPDTTAASVVAYLDEVDYQGSWETWPGLPKQYQGADPHGMLLTTYLNSAALEVVKDGGTTMPDGAILVKENFTPEGVLDATTIMYKKAGYDPDNNDWFWAKVLADGTVEKEGQVEGCQTCHGAAIESDYVMTGTN